MEGPNNKRYISYITTRTFSYSSRVNYSDSLSLDKAKMEIEAAIANYKSLPSEGHTSEDFRQLANGVFQSEGTVSARFKGDAFSIVPVVALGQTYSSESLAFFVRLYHEIGKIGALSITETMSGKLYIVWKTESWKDILSGVSKYFSNIYGEKFIGFQKLSKIYELKSNLTDDNCKVTLVKLVYSLAESGRSRKLLRWKIGRIRFNK